MPRDYSKPRILPQTEGMMNKFGAMTTRYQDTIDGVAVTVTVDPDSGVIAPAGR